MTVTLSRRRFARAAFVGALGALATAAGATTVAMLYPRRGNSRVEVLVPRDRVPAPGGPPLFVAAGRLFLVNLARGEGFEPPVSGGASRGLLAVSARCTHLNCTVRWRPDYQLGMREDSQFLVCACHAGIFTRAGVRVFAPPPRSLDTFAVRVTALGDVVVDTRAVRVGDMRNPQRAVPWPAG